jgi:OOP family OmpA-OmpF porin
MTRSIFTAAHVAAALLATVTLAGVASPAHAQVAFSGNAYFGASAGRSKSDIDCTGTLTCDTSATGWKVFGGYLFHPNFGVEGSWYQSGKSSFSAAVEGLTATGEFKSRGFGLYALAQAAQGPWNGFVKLGAVSARATGAARVADISGSISETHTQVGWGAGVGYDFTRNFGARLEVERNRAELLGEKVNVDLVSLGLLARF